MAIRTNVQKKTQILLLKEILRICKLSFNEYFETFYREKEDCVASIESRNVRIQEIQNELRIQEDFFKPRWLNEELPNSAV